MANDALVKAGTRGDTLYFVACGTVAVYNNAGREVKDLGRGIFLTQDFKLPSHLAYNFRNSFEICALKEEAHASIPR